MRLRFLLTMLLFIPFVVKGQSVIEQPDHKVTFYNTGAIYTAPTTRSATTEREKMVMIIDGSAQFAKGSAVKMQDNSAFGLTGDFVSLVNETDPTSETIFVDTDKSGFQTGKVWFANSSPFNVNIPTAAKPVNMVSIETVPGLKLNEKQRIIMNSSNRSTHYIAFPHIAVDNGSYLAVDTTAAVLTNGVHLNAASWFTLEAAYDTNNSRVLNVGYLKSRNATGIVRESTAGVVSGYNSSNYNTWHQGRAFLDLQSYNPQKNGANSVVTNGMPGSNRTTDGEFLLTGFTPIQGRNLPSGQYGVRADYMFFNTLLDPKPWSLTGSTGPIVDPTFDMKPGKGYFMAQDVATFDFGYIEGANTGLDGASGLRSVGGYKFNRDLLNSGSVFNGFNRFVTTTGDASTSNINNLVDNSEAFLNMENSDTQSYSVTLSKGLNFLGNPYTSPLDLTDIISVTEEDGVKSLPDWGVTVSANNLDAQIRNKYWIVGDGKIKHREEGGKNYFLYNVTYWDSSSGASVGGTSTTTIDAQNGLIAPMQMFALQSSKDNVTIKLPNSKTKFGKTTLRKAAVTEKLDELLLQSVVLGSENENAMEDRLTVVLRDNASLSSTDNSDSRKAIVNAQGSAVHNQGGELTDIGEDPLLTYNGIIYTKSSEGVAMLTNTIPTTVKQVAVFFTPTNQEERVRIKPYRMESLQSVQRVWLIDRFENKQIELTPETEYVFTSRPLKGEQAKENRFILHFGDSPNETIVDEVLPITCYYNSSIIYIDGLNEGDINSQVYIYDLQGRLMGKTTVTNAPSMQYMKTLGLGTYIVRIAGKRNFTTKFVTIQN